MRLLGELQRLTVKILAKSLKVSIALRLLGELQPPFFDERLRVEAEGFNSLAAVRRVAMNNGDRYQIYLYTVSIALRL